MRDFDEDDRLCMQSCIQIIQNKSEALLKVLDIDEKWHSHGDINYRHRNELIDHWKSIQDALDSVLIGFTEYPYNDMKTNRKDWS